MEADRLAVVAVNRSYGSDTATIEVDDREAIGKIRVEVCHTRFFHIATEQDLEVTVCVDPFDPTLIVFRTRAVPQWYPIRVGDHNVVGTAEPVRGHQQQTVKTVVFSFDRETGKSVRETSQRVAGTPTAVTKHKEPGLIRFHAQYMGTAATPVEHD
jgi:hypothetical protein